MQVKTFRSWLLDTYQRFLKMPNHYKAIFIEAGEYYKIGEIEKAKQLIEIGLEVCKN